MNQYHIDYLTAASRSIERLERPTQQRVLAGIAKLVNNPRPHGSIKLAGQHAYRIRVGDYRILTQFTTTAWL